MHAVQTNRHLWVSCRLGYWSLWPDPAPDELFMRAPIVRLAEACRILDRGGGGSSSLIHCTLLQDRQPTDLRKGAARDATKSKA
eukprot:968595-Alexandrium_andersonii.AAC.1